MNPPRVYTCSPSWTPLPAPSLYHPSGSSQCTSPKLPVSCIEPGLAIRFIYDIIHVSVPFSQIILRSPSPTESKRLFYTSVSLLLSRIQGYRYHLSKFHIYALVYCTCVFLSGLLQSSEKFKKKVGWIERVALVYIHYHAWNRQVVGTCCIAQGAQLDALRRPRGVQCGRETQRMGECMYTYSWFMLLHSRN